jgi:hypothetical protein
MCPPVTAQFVWTMASLGPTSTMKITVEIHYFKKKKKHLAEIFSQYFLILKYATFRSSSSVQLLSDNGILD